MTNPATSSSTAGPLARDALRQITQDRGGCFRPVQLRRTNLDTGEVTQVLIPCGSTLETACPACAKRAQGLRAEQCRDGWHLEDEPTDPHPVPDDEQEFWLTCAPALRCSATRPSRPRTLPNSIRQSPSSTT